MIRCKGLEYTKIFDSKFRFHVILNLENPQTLPEKVSWIALHGNLEQMAECTDKWKVRDYVAQKGLSHILIPVYGQPITDAGSIPFDQYPDAFVLKATHGCKMNYICQDKADLNKHECSRVVAEWLNTIYGTYSVEPHYQLISPRAYCEKLMGKGEPLVDYKIFCLNGRPDFILVCGEREIDEKKGESRVSLQIYDTDWNMLPVVKGFQGHYAKKKPVKKPELLDQMLEIAGCLSSEFDFVRVDLYEIDGRVYFGELTFTPAAGVMPAYEEQFLLEKGRELIISGKNG